jgi:hypothetical protein
MSRISTIELTQTCDGADILTIDANAWDEIRCKYVLLDERVLFPGNSVELWAGYGGAARVGNSDLVCKGRFDIINRDPDYEPDGVTVRFIAFDGLRRMMDNTQARVFHGFNRDSDVVIAMAKEYGWDVDNVPTPASPLPASTAHTRRAKKTAVVQTKNVPGDRVKPIQMTDLAFIKKMAECYGYQYPKIKYDPQTRRETLVFRPPASGPDDWTQTFRYRAPGTGASDIISFQPSFSISDTPTGVELLGWDKEKGRPFRVIATVSQSQKIDVKFDEEYRVDDKIEKSIRSGAELRLSLLGSSTEQVALRRVVVDGKAWSPLKEVPDVLTTSMLPALRTDREYLEAFAVQWLRDRLAAWWTATFSLENQPGIHLLDSDQVHELRGMAPMDEGWYILLSAKHTWSDGKHVVDCSAQKLIEDPSMQVNTEAMA